MAKEDGPRFNATMVRSVAGFDRDVMTDKEVGVLITEWWNGEGVDVAIHTGEGDRTMALSHDEMRLLARTWREFKKSGRKNK